MTARLSFLVFILIAISSRAEFSTHPAPELSATDPSNSSSVSRYEQRQMYKDAIKFIQSGQISRYRTLKEKLKGYPLYPYLEYMRKIYSISHQDAESILGFAERYPDTPIADQLVQNWLYNLAQRGHWEEFLTHYNKEIAAPKIDCFHAYALYKTGEREAAYAAGQELWLVDYSQPDECDSIFRILRQEGQLTPELAWQRFAMSLTSNEVSLATYLMRFLDRDDRQLARNFKMVHTKPYNVGRTHIFSDQHEKNREMVLHGIERLAPLNSGKAFDAFEEYQAIHEFSPSQLKATWERIGILLAVDGDPGNRLDRVPLKFTDYPELTEARIRLALRRQNWSDALVLINALPEDLQATPRWQYWQARVLMGSNDPADRMAANDIYAELANSRNYYGFLAADALGRPYDFDDVRMQIDREQVLSMEATPGIQRALELFVLDELTRARHEWYFTTKDFSPIEREIVARVAQKWGWYRHAIYAMIEAEAWNDLEIRFPLAYQHNFLAGARTADIPLHWSLAVARQESAFMPDAKSSAGALGVMQLMPRTADLVARDVAIGSVSRHDLIDPGVNIHLGSAYLGNLLRRFKQNRIFATAAYNAGPSRVDKWLDPSLPMDVWIETIPYRETREYVQSVLIFGAIYNHRLQYDQPMIFANEKADFSSHAITLTTPTPVEQVAASE
ncbi:MAG: transglycosylase SLT domain-containing protein [Pseudomonadales bacterium]